jgi:integrase
VSDVLTVAREHFPDWYPLVLCGFRTGSASCSGCSGAIWIGEKASSTFNAHGCAPRGRRRKNGEDRTVDMSQQLRAELRLWRLKQSQVWMKRGLSRPAVVFPSTVGTPLDDSNVRKAFAAILRKADVRHRNVHAMRHTFISLLLQLGESPAYLQKQAGHKSMDITINVYGHFIPGGNRAAVDRLDDVSPKRGKASTAA